MRQIRMVICILMVALIASLSVVGNDLPSDRPEQVRAGMTICGALLGLGIAIPAALDVIPSDTPLSDSLLVVVPVAAVTTTTILFASRWIAEVTLSLEPSLLSSPFLGAALGLVGGAFAGGISFALGMSLAIPIVNVSTGSLNYPQSIGMGFLAGALWGGIFGIPAGALAVPIISLYMSF